MHVAEQRAGREKVYCQLNTSHRYSSKERDGTGLYYYGYRYYAPWLQRWISTDPFKKIDGLNFYSAMRNNPVAFLDVEGAAVLNAIDYQSGGGFQYKKIVVDYEIPKLHPGGNLKFYLGQSKRGNAFTGIININTGAVDIYPLASERRLGGAVDVWRVAYKGQTHDGQSPILHSPQGIEGPTSHEQAIEIFSGAKETHVGFSFQDV